MQAYDRFAVFNRHVVVPSAYMKAMYTLLSAASLIVVQMAFLRCVQPWLCNLGFVYLGFALLMELAILLPLDRHTVVS